MKLFPAFCPNNKPKISGSWPYYNVENKVFQQPKIKLYFNSMKTNCVFNGVQNNGKVWAGFQSKPWAQ